MHQIDFLPVENEDGDSTKSGDAIAMQFTNPATGLPIVVVIDSGTTMIGDKVADHIEKVYGTKHVDLLISTHPDTDHLNGISALLDRCSVGELMMHLPWNHDSRADELGNYERIVSVHNKAVELSIPVTEPFTGDMRFGGAITILGPNLVYYTEMLAAAIDRELTGTSSLSASFGGGLGVKLAKVLERTLARFPIETLTDVDDTSPRNKTSVITLLRVDDRRFMFTGDAGIDSLENASAYYEGIVGSFASFPLYLFQAPHHGSHHNVGPTILDRILGPKDAGYGTTFGISSSAKSSEKHPSPRVTNAIGRRGAQVFATEGITLGVEYGVSRGWVAASPIGPLVEDGD